MVDVTSLILLAASFFFVAISLALLVRYRQVSLRINASTDMGRDLWSSLEQRLKKQDERIIDMMGRVEVIQARVTAGAVAQAPLSMPPPASAPASAPPAASEPSSGHSQSPPAQQPESQESQPSQALPAASGADFELDETQVAALKLLSDAPKNTRQLTDALGKSREHTARIMKALFELALVRRNDSSKPFVYQLTEEGSRRLSTGSQTPSS
jgi:DNA-binding transcriptional ArsR family regulator